MLTPLGTYEPFAETKQLSEGVGRRLVREPAACGCMAGVTRAHQPYSHRMLTRQASKPRERTAGVFSCYCLRRMRMVKAGGLPAQSCRRPQMRKVAPIEM